jgi:hypothetical protein
MKRKEVIKFIESNINEFFIDYNFQQVNKGKGDLALWYNRESDIGFENMTINLNSYGEKHDLSFGFDKGYFKIEDILLKYNEVAKYKINLHYRDRLSSIIGFGNGVLSNLNWQDIMKTQDSFEGILKQIEHLKKFTTETALPLLDKFQDLRYLYSELQKEEFWLEKDKKYYIFHADLVRLIVSKLINSSKYEADCNRSFEIAELLSAENGYPFVYDRNDLSMPLPCIINILKDIQPIY